MKMTKLAWGSSRWPDQTPFWHFQSLLIENMRFLSYDNSLSYLAPVQ